MADRITPIESPLRRPLMTGVKVVFCALAVLSLSPATGLGALARSDLEIPAEDAEGQPIEAVTVFRRVEGTEPIRKSEIVSPAVCGRNQLLGISMRLCCRPAAGHSFENGLRAPLRC